MSSSITLGDFITHAKQKKKKETEVKPSISVEHCIENEIFFEEQIKILHSRELSLFSSNPYLPAPYIDQMQSNQFSSNVLFLLQELVRFQQRLIKQQPMKAKTKKRLVFGFQEVLKKTHKLKAIIIATDIQKEFYDSLQSVKRAAYAQNIPVFYASKRHELGKLLSSKVSIGIVGILSLEGGLDIFKSVKDMHDSLSSRWYQLFISSHSVNKRNESWLWLLCYHGFNIPCSLSIQSHCEEIDCILGYSPLLIACKRGNYHVLKALFAANADLDYCSFKKESAALLSSTSNYETFSLVCQEKLAKTTSTKFLRWLEREDFAGNNPLKRVISNPNKFNLESFEAILKWKGKIADFSLLLQLCSNPDGSSHLSLLLKYFENPLDVQQDSILICAVRSQARMNVISIRKYLLECKASDALSYFDRKDTSGKSASDYAIESEDDQIPGILSGLHKKLSTRIQSSSKSNKSKS